MSVKKALDARGFFEIAYPSQLANTVLSAMHSWQEFCQLKEEEKSLLSNGDRLRDYGYMYRRDGTGKADAKELFHVSLRDVQSLQSAAEKLPKSATRFIDACSDLITDSDAIIMQFADRLESEYGLVGFTHQVAASKLHWTFRFLHYFGAEVLAHPHVDRGGFTLHLCETSEGVEYLGFDNVWYPLPLSEGKTIFFPGMVLQHRSDGVVKALWHRVMSTKQAVHRERFAMVAFVDFAHTHRYNDAALRTQDIPPGETYSLSHEVFSKFFTVV